MFASRAVLSQHTLVIVPVMISVSIPRPRSMASRSEEFGRNALNRCLSTLRSCGEDVELGIELVAERAGAQLKVALFRSRHHASLPLGQLEARIVADRVAQEHHEAAAQAKRACDRIDVRHDVARVRIRQHLAGRQEGVLQIDHDQRRRAGIQLVESAARFAELERPGWNFDLVHALSS